MSIRVPLNLVAVGAYLRACREHHHITRKALADTTGTSISQIERIENGGLDTRASLLLAVVRAVRGDIHTVMDVLFDATVSDKAAIEVAQQHYLQYLRSYVLRSEPHGVNASSNNSSSSDMQCNTVFAAIDRERAYQDQQCPIEEHGHDIGGWITLVRHQLRKAEEAWCGQHDDASALNRLLRVVVVTVACLQQHGVVERHALNP